MRRCVVAVLMLMTLGGAARGQEPDKRPPITPQPDPVRTTLEPTSTVSSANADLAPGDEAPAFQLDSSLGRAVRLADLKGHWSVLLFDENRMKLAPLAGIGDSIRALGMQPYGICPDGVSALKALAARDRIDFPLLSDPTREISQLFGMYDERSQAIQPGLVILDARGVVRMALQGPSLDADDVLQMVTHVLQHN